MLRRLIASRENLESQTRRFASMPRGCDQNAIDRAHSGSDEPRSDIARGLEGRHTGESMRKFHLVIGCAIILVATGCTSTSGVPTRVDAPDQGLTTSIQVASSTASSATSTETTGSTPTTASSTTTSSSASTSDSPQVGVSDAVPLTGDEIFVNDSLAHKTIPCDDESVIINGSLNEITFTGMCASTLTNGSLNRITFDSVGSITINGAKNQVTWNSGTSSDAPDVNDRGFGNLINQG